MENGKFIVVEGIDGAGKTTLTKMVGAKMNLESVERKDISRIHPFVYSQMVKHKQLLWTETGEYDHMLPVAYWIQLQAAWHILSTEFVVKPLLTQGTNVLMDGWYYKFMARLWAQGEDRDFVGMAFSKVMEPDYVILLNVDFDIVFERKIDIRAYEYGKFKYDRISEEKKTFVQYQRETFFQLQNMKKENWFELILGRCSLEESYMLLKQKIIELL